MAAPRKTDWALNRMTRRHSVPIKINMPITVEICLIMRHIWVFTRSPPMPAWGCIQYGIWVMKNCLTCRGCWEGAGFSQCTALCVCLNFCCTWTQPQPGPSWDLVKRANRLSGDLLTTRTRWTMSGEGDCACQEIQSASWCIMGYNSILVSV